jgi:Fibronectin type III domain
VLRSPTVVTVEWKPPKDTSAYLTYDFQVKPKDKNPHNIGPRTSYNVGGLKADTRYTVTVTPFGAPQHQSASKSFTTPKKK